MPARALPGDDEELNELRVFKRPKKEPQATPAPAPKPAAPQTQARPAQARPAPPPAHAHANAGELDREPGLELEGPGAGGGADGGSGAARGEGEEDGEALVGPVYREEDLDEGDEEEDSPKKKKKKTREAGRGAGGRGGRRARGGNSGGGAGRSSGSSRPSLQLVPASASASASAPGSGPQLQRQAPRGREWDGRELPAAGREAGPGALVHSALAGELKGHQLEAVRFLWRVCVTEIDERQAQLDAGAAQQRARTRRRGPSVAIGGGILAHCMGLGKTLSTIAFLHTRHLQARRDLGVHRTPCFLLVVPVNTLENWLCELARWLPGNADPFFVHTLEDVPTDQVKGKLEAWRQFGGALLVGYERFRNLVLPPKHREMVNKARAKLRRMAVRVTAEAMRRLNEEREAQGRAPVSRKHLIDRAMPKANRKLIQAKQRIRRDRLDGPGEERWRDWRLLLTSERLGPAHASRLLDVVVLDEGHRLKSDESQTTVAAELVNARRRVILTGYPLQNNLWEYYHMISYVQPKKLRTLREFWKTFIFPIDQGSFRDSSAEDVRRMYQRLFVLHQKVRGFVERRDAGFLREAISHASARLKREFVIQVALDPLSAGLYAGIVAAAVNGTLLPDCDLSSNPLIVRIVAHKIMNTPEVLRRYLARVRAEFHGHLGYDEVGLDDDLEEQEEEEEENADAPAPAPGRGRRLRTPPKIKYKSFVPPDFEKRPPFAPRDAPKIAVALDIVKQCVAIGDKVLVFSTSLSTLDVLQEAAADELGYEFGRTAFRIDGSTDPRDRQQHIDRFNARPEATLFLISTVAGGIGVNLVAANRIVIMDVCWNPCNDTQALFRAYRYGQKKDVFVYRLVAGGTIEARVYANQVVKQSLFRRTVDSETTARHVARQEAREYLSVPLDWQYPSRYASFLEQDAILASIVRAYSVPAPPGHDDEDDDNVGVELEDDGGCGGPAHAHAHADPLRPLGVPSPGKRLKRARGPPPAGMVVLGVHDHESLLADDDPAGRLTEAEKREGEAEAARVARQASEEAAREKKREAAQRQVQKWGGPRAPGAPRDSSSSSGSGEDEGEEDPERGDMYSRALAIALPVAAAGCSSAVLPVGQLQPQQPQPLALPLPLPSHAGVEPFLPPHSDESEGSDGDCVIIGSCSPGAIRATGAVGKLKGGASWQPHVGATQAGAAADAAAAHMHATPIKPLAPGQAPPFCDLDLSDRDESAAPLFGGVAGARGRRLAAPSGGSSSSDGSRIGDSRTAVSCEKVSAMNNCKLTGTWRSFASGGAGMHRGQRRRPLSALCALAVLALGIAACASAAAPSVKVYPGAVDASSFGVAASTSTHGRSLLQYQPPAVDNSLDSYYSTTDLLEKINPPFVAPNTTIDIVAINVYVYYNRVVRRDAAGNVVEVSGIHDHGGKVFLLKDEAWSLKEKAQKTREPVEGIEPMTLRCTKGTTLHIRMTHNITNTELNPENQQEYVGIMISGLPYQTKKKNAVTGQEDVYENFDPRAFAAKDETVEYVVHCEREGAFSFHDMALPVDDYSGLEAAAAAEAAGHVHAGQLVTDGSMEEAAPPPPPSGPVKTNSVRRGLFGGIIVEPENCFWRSPITGKPVDKGTHVDVLCKSPESSNESPVYAKSYREHATFFHDEAETMMPHFVGPAPPELHASMHGDHGHGGEPLAEGTEPFRFQLKEGEYGAHSGQFQLAPTVRGRLNYDANFTWSVGPDVGARSFEFDIIFTAENGANLTDYLQLTVTEGTYEKADAVCTLERVSALRYKAVPGEITPDTYAEVDGYLQLVDRPENNYCYEKLDDIFSLSPKGRIIQFRLHDTNRAYPHVMFNERNEPGKAGPTLFDYQIMHGLIHPNEQTLEVHAIHAINYRAEPHMTRHSTDCLEGGYCDELKCTDEDCMHSSWRHGDPATPILRHYIGDARRACWRRNPRDELSKIVDSQIIAPHASYLVEPINGAGSVNRAAGDAIYHCHLYPHFGAGMWGLFRAFDRLEDGSRLYPDGTPVRRLIPLPTDFENKPLNKEALRPTPNKPGWPHYIPVPRGIGSDHKPVFSLQNDGTPFPFPRPSAPKPPGFYPLDSYLGRVPEPLEKNALDPRARPGAWFNNPCPIGAKEMNISIVAIQVKTDLNTYGWYDPQGRMYVRAEDAADYLSGKRKPEPFFFRATAKTCIVIEFTNLLPPTIGGTYFQPLTITAYSATHVHLVKFDPQSSDSGHNGWNYHTGVFTNRQATFVWYANEQFDYCFFHDHLAANAQQQHGLYGGLIVEHEDSTVHDSASGALMPYPAVGAQVIIRNPNVTIQGENFREFVMGVLDFRYAFDRMQKPINEQGYHNFEGDPGVKEVSYRTAPLEQRTGGSFDTALAFSSCVHGDPDTPLFKAYNGDKVRVHVIAGSHEEMHGLSINRFPWHIERRNPKSPIAQTFPLGVSLTNTGEFRVTNPGTRDYDVMYAQKAVDALWLGVWGIIRVYGTNATDLAPVIHRNFLRNDPYVKHGECPAKNTRSSARCDGTSPIRRFRVSARHADIIFNDYGDHDPNGIWYMLETVDGVETQLYKEYIRVSTAEASRRRLGDCIEVELVNRLTQTLAPREDYPGTPAPPIPPSKQIGLHATLVSYDLLHSDGYTVGYNPVQSIAPFYRITYVWRATHQGVGTLHDMSDYINKAYHGAIGAIVVEPRGAVVQSTLDGLKGRHSVKVTYPACNPGPEDPPVLEGSSPPTPLSCGGATKSFYECVLISVNGLSLVDKWHRKIKLPIEVDFGDHGEKGFGYASENMRNRIRAANYRRESLFFLDGDTSNGRNLPSTPLCLVPQGSHLYIRNAVPGSAERQMAIKVEGIYWRSDFVKNDNAEAQATTGGLTPGVANSIFPFNPFPSARHFTGNARESYYYMSPVQNWDLLQGAWGIINATATEPMLY
eukprot:tig00000339_g24187.t1